MFLNQGSVVLIYHQYLKINNLIQAEIKNGSKDYDPDFIRKHIEKLTS